MPDGPAAADAGQRGLEEHYAHYFGDLSRDFRAVSLSRLVASLTPPGRVLDVGCGSGATSEVLWRRGHQVVSMDPSDAMVAMCREHLGRAGLSTQHVRLGGVESISEQAAYDAVIALDVIEHIEDDLAALRHLRRALVPSGRLILSVPALSRLFGPKDVAVGHYRRYDRQPLCDLLARAGFAVERRRFWNALGVLPVWISVARGKRLSERVRYAGRSRAARVLNDALRIWFLVVENHIPSPIGLTLVVVARPLDRL
jgi:SAM-dependent methyltransferase